MPKQLDPKTQAAVEDAEAILEPDTPLTPASKARAQALADEIINNPKGSKAKRPQLSLVQYTAMLHALRIIKSVGVREWRIRTGENPVNTLAAWAGVELHVAAWVITTANAYDYAERTAMLHKTAIEIYKQYSKGFAGGKSNKESGLVYARNWVKTAYGVRGKLPK